MNNAIIRSHSVGTTYQALASSETIASVTIETPSANSAVVYFQGDDGSDVEIAAGSSYVFLGIDLAQFYVKGTVGDVVNIIGGTW